MGSQCAVYDFRISAEGVSEEDIIKTLKQLAKHYVFQEEKGSKTGYLHYQGRMSLIKKARQPEALALWKKVDLTPPPNYLEPTTNEEFRKKSFSYAMKIDTRTRGPWDDQKPDEYIPRQYRNKMENLYPFQKIIFDSSSIFDDRIINMIYCPHGNAGKSTVACLSELFGKGIDLPPVNDADKLVASCCDICMKRELRDPSPIFVDLPRAMNKERLNGIYTAIEQIKKGKLYDLRYTYKVWWIDSPQIWVFSNIEPDISLLSKDRWRVWTINSNKELVKFVAPTRTDTLFDPLENKPSQSLL